MKKQILIVSPPLHTGGATSSLLALLHTLDYNRYDVDLLLMRIEGEFLGDIPKEVNVLPPALTENNYYLAKIQKFFVYFFLGYFFRRFFYSISRGKKYPHGDFQLMSGLARCNVARKIKKEYDVALGYMEGFENVYVATKVKAKKKIGYIHVEYENAGLDPNLDRKIFSKLDSIVLVSKTNKEIFDKVFPEFSHKSKIVENMISYDKIKKAQQVPINDFPTDSSYFNIVTAARLNLAHKGLNRGLLALKRLKEEGFRLRWYVFGDGPDRHILEQLIEEHQLNEDFILMGERTNIYPYLSKADLFMLPSHYEGKPIVVNEAQAVGVVPMVTEYWSSREQIQDEIDGIILENSQEGIYNGIRKIINNRELLNNIKENVSKKDFANQTGIIQFYQLIEE